MNELYGRILSYFSRKFVLVLALETLATVVLWHGLITGDNWTAITLGLAGLGIAGNVAAKFTGGKTNGDCTEKDM